MKPLSKLMNERKERIEKGLLDAKKNAELIEDSRKMYNAELVRARKEAQTLIKNMHEEVGKKREEMLGRVEGEASKMIAEAKEKIEKEKEIILKQVEEKVAFLVILGVEKILAEQIDPKKNAELISKTIHKTS